jgi:hypothetical protein
MSPGNEEMSGREGVRKSTAFNEASSLHIT